MKKNKSTKHTIFYPDALWSEIQKCANKCHESVSTYLRRSVMERMERGLR